MKQFEFFFIQIATPAIEPGFSTSYCSYLFIRDLAFLVDPAMADLFLLLMAMLCREGFEGSMFGLQGSSIPTATAATTTSDLKQS